ncbi:uncharacterized protein LOC105422034 [Pogonomyrmex barbatus]|uniref:Uncharacterized protein LOC105422034 n=1 Tax=Pogonomyrmex barbatus TaxID=144034 RepID=A0A6I9VV06_9HYME|nr:uncharacterized protein LOC105422034 [Pogonomyrmex barbatus]
MIMWRSSKRLIINCVQFVIRCGRNFDADDLDDISDFDVQDVPSNVAIITSVAILYNPERKRSISQTRRSLTLQRDTEGLNGRFNVLVVHFQPQTFGLPRQPRQDDFQHRPDAPGARRTSPPEVVTKVLQALEEMGEPIGPSTAEKLRGGPSNPLGYLLHPVASSRRTS